MISDYITRRFMYVTVSLLHTIAAGIVMHATGNYENNETLEAIADYQATEAMKFLNELSNGH